MRGSIFPSKKISQATIDKVTLSQQRNLKIPLGKLGGPMQKTQGQFYLKPSVTQVRTNQYKSKNKLDNSSIMLDTSVHLEN